MLLIANRGNRFGRNPERENSPEYLNEAIAQGYHVMIDTWWMGGSFWFGNNYPSWKPMGGGADWLVHAMNSVWIRARNPEVLLRASDLGLNVFWQQTDQYSHTTWGNLLGFYGAPRCGPNFVHVLPQYAFDIAEHEVENILQSCEDQQRTSVGLVYALCCDHVGKIEQVLNAAPSSDPRHVTLQNV